MNKFFSKYLFLILAFLVAIGSWIYTYYLAQQLAKGEKQRIELWSQAYQEIQITDVNQNICPIVLKIIESNTTIPVILTDENNKIIAYANLDHKKAKDSAYLYKQLEKMKIYSDPIIIELSPEQRHYLYYKESKLLTQLTYFPIIQLIVAIVFLTVIFYAAQSTRKVEENQLWIAMSKETAHQLGTPISSLIAWVEMLKLMNLDEKLIKEVEKDVIRLEKVTERFSKIGSNPELVPTDLKKVINDAVNYLKLRSPRKITYSINCNTDKPIIINLNPPLFEWVIENLAKNAIDAMEGKGKIEINIYDKANEVIIDFKDQGKGIPKKYLKSIFQPGFTTKKYGWGMGLALVKRIVENYHNGKIFVLNSSPKGTTFRIILNKKSL